MASLFLGCSLVSLVEIIYIIYKSLLMLKYKYTKVNTVTNQEEDILYHRQITYKFSKPMYTVHSNKLATVNHKVKY